MHSCVSRTLAAFGGKLPPLTIPSELCDQDEHHRGCDWVELKEMFGDKRWNNFGCELMVSGYVMPLRYMSVRAGSSL